MSHNACRTDWRSLSLAAYECHLRRPVAKPGTGEAIAEREYLEQLRDSYLHTVEMVGNLFPTLESVETPKLLEIGAYFGVVSCALQEGGWQVTAQDTSTTFASDSLRERYTQSGIKLSEVNDLRRPLPYPDHTFNALICCELLEHLPFNTVPLGREMRRVLRPGGFAFISVPNLASAARRWQLLRGQSTRDSFRVMAAQPDSDNWHWREFTESDLRDWLDLAGFQKIQTGFRTYRAAHHPNPLRRALVRWMYALFPSLQYDVWAVAR